MKICHILAGIEEGGLEKHVEDLCNRLAFYHEIHVIAHRKYQNRFNRSVIFHPLDLSKGRRNILTLYRLYRLINHIKPDIVHAHANKAADMVANIRYMISKSVKTIATLHSQKRNLKSFETFDHVIGVSAQVLKELKNPCKSVVYNGINLAAIKKDPDYLKQFGIENEFVICGIGRLEEVKNFSLLIRAIKDLGVKLLMIGEGSEREKLQTLVKTLDVQEKVIFTGFRKDIPEILANTDLCVISSDREGFSYVMAESLLLETPVVSTDVGDMRLILPSSFVVPGGNYKELAKAIVYVKLNYHEAFEEFQTSFAFAKEHFTLDAMIETTLKLYKEVFAR